MIENIRKNSLPNEFHSNRRDAIRRAENFGFRIQIDNSRQAFHSLYELHKSNMIGIGGKYKVLKSFELIQDIFTPDEDFNLWIAKEKDKIVAGLLVFYFKDTVEYWLPASHLDYKKHQPLSLIIWIAMKDSILRKRCRSWNWGGTWIDQKGVYDFKSRWGASDLAYNYYTRLFNKQKLPSQQFIHYTKQYPDFYVLPKKILEVPK
jgi:lipid II:glycine glycyltransferase (peptidoglycan interpeptide bridge formation enzyme)